jgi:hypothetical protein
MFSSFGTCVDVQVWRDNTITTGINATDYCQLFADRATLVDGRCYTNNFGGTSEVSAIIAGFVASVQGILKARGLRPLNSREHIALFRDTLTGHPQLDDFGTPML